MLSSRLNLFAVFILVMLVLGVWRVDTAEGNASVVAGDPENARNAAGITCNGFLEAKHILRRAYDERVTQREVAFHLEAVMRSLGSDGPLSFPTLVISGDELAEPHGDALDDTTHRINPGSEPIVMIDMGAKYHGFCSDVTRTFFFESATSEMFDAYEAVLAAEMNVIDAIAPGVAVRDLDSIVDVALADFVALEGVSGLTYWGHGVGRWVHEQPLLWGGSDDVLEVGDVLAIEPGLYFDDGWAVRVEDTVLVTETGFEILSNLPRELADVIIRPLDSCVLGDIHAQDYSYGKATNITFSITSHEDPVDSVELFNGYDWLSMLPINDTAYSISYHLNSSYSGRVNLIARVNTNGELWHFSDVYRCDALASEQLSLEPAIQANPDTEPPESPLLWTISCENASMIRVLFDALDAPLYDQFLIMDSEGRVVMDYRGIHEKFYWSEWVTGNEVTIRIAASDSPLFGGVGDFRLTVDTLEVVYGNPYVPQTTPKVTINTTTTTTTQSTAFGSGRLFTGLMVGSIASALMILVAYQILLKKRD